LSSIVPPFATAWRAPIDCCCFDLRRNDEFQRKVPVPISRMTIIFADAHV
jgi:hypothetical protein